MPEMIGGTEKTVVVAGILIGSKKCFVLGEFGLIASFTGVSWIPVTYSA